MKLSEFNFGEYDARREFLRDERYFISTFIDQSRFRLARSATERTISSLDKREQERRLANYFWKARERKSKGT